MPRVARIVILNCPRHVTQRGNNRQDVFFVDDDRMTYLGLLKEESEKHGLRVEGYCLMNTHRARPLGSDSFLSKIESLLGRRLRPLPVGRPRNKNK